MVEIKRKIFFPQGIIGGLYIDSDLICYTLERPWANNIPFISCIPTGEYQCAGFTGKKFKEVWEIQNVPNRTYILIHKANKVAELQGCIAIGLGLYTRNFEIRLSDSRGAYKALQAFLPLSFSLKIKDDQQ